MKMRAFLSLGRTNYFATNNVNFCEFEKITSNQKLNRLLSFLQMDFPDTLDKFSTVNVETVIKVSRYPCALPVEV